MEKFSLFPSFIPSKQPKSTPTITASDNESADELIEKTPFIAQKQPLSQPNDSLGDKQDKSEMMLKILASHAKAVNRIKSQGAPK